MTTNKLLRPTDRSITADMLRVEIGKGCCLVLTPTEYGNAIARGKRLRRAEKMRQRQNASQDKRDAADGSCEARDELVLYEPPPHRNASRLAQ